MSIEEYKNGPDDLDKNGTIMDEEIDEEIQETIEEIREEREGDGPDDEEGGISKEVQWIG